MYLVKCDYSTYGKVEYAVNTEGYILKDSAFENDVILTIGVQHGDEKKFIKTIQDISNGTAEITELEGEYVTKIL